MEKQKLLLHSCCAPCSSGVIGQLVDDFLVTVYFFNPNIYPEQEFEKRKNEQIKYLEKAIDEFKVNLVIEDYLKELYEDAIKGFEQEKEGGSRCDICFYVRMKKSAEYAKEHGFDCFTTTLSVSPYKNADKLNEIGLKIENEVGIKYLPANFKKKNGYLNSINNSKKYDIYRQKYCGCKYSMPKENLEESN